MMTPKGAQRAVARLSLLKFFPGDPAARAALMEDIGSICQSDEEAVWLAGRVLDLCQEWPGPLAVWQIYFNRYPPRNERQRMLDRSCGSTDAFPNGVPSETGRQEFEVARLSAGGDQRQIPAPRDPVAAQVLADVVSGVKGLGSPPAQTLEDLAREVSERAAAERAPKPRIFPRVEPEKPITAQDVEAAITERGAPAK